MLTNLLNGYKAASDSVFVKYSERKKETNEDGQYLTPTALMLLADNKFKTLRLKWECNATYNSKEISRPYKRRSRTSRKRLARGIITETSLIPRRHRLKILGRSQHG